MKPRHYMVIVGVGLIVAAVPVAFFGAVNPAIGVMAFGCALICTASVITPVS